MNTEHLDQNKAEINESFNSLFSNVDNLISEMKLLSSEEILNGSVLEELSAKCKIGIRA